MTAHINDILLRVLMRHNDAIVVTYLVIGDDVFLGNYRLIVIGVDGTLIYDEDKHYFSIGRTISLPINEFSAKTKIEVNTEESSDYFVYLTEEDKKNIEACKTYHRVRMKSKSMKWSNLKHRN